MIDMLRRRADPVLVVDMSPVMLARIAAETQRKPGVAVADVQCIQAEWLRMPPFDQQLGVVLADNAFSFLAFPEGWRTLCRVLARRMQRGGRLIMRILSVPVGHRAVSANDLVEQYRGRQRINYTEVRARLLFAHWNGRTRAIVTEDVLNTFETHRDLFEELIRRSGAEANDLETVEKYRGTGAVYYAPPLADAISVIRERFEVLDVQYGPYAVAEYFPLIVAAKV
jgi:SAM-dependent methyltransferase